ncbi:4Fe4S ferredoxin [Paratrimastix pyriformis]|uniref:4Fe4S ferredoxin n=1 Tax=Paratrimastix pyriformis TaxID=342808 RepID=A0ABQ8UHF8_9EUKA|nr:4Fe4S ferredoxin [Paratrimastix pyriformis]
MDFPHVDTSLCTGCGTCASNCPIDGLWKLVENKAVFTDDRAADCIHCDTCKNNCPAGAITFSS